MKKSICILIVLLLGNISYAQFNRYLITFKDKNNSPFSLTQPGQYLSQRALDRRSRYQIAIDSTDLPVNKRYIDSVRNTGAVTVLNTSKWLNQISIETTDANALALINSFPFVASSQPIAARNGGATQQKFNEQPQGAAPYNSAKVAEEPMEYGAASAQVKIHRGDFLHRHGFTGQNMHLAVLDAGFYRYDVLPTFDSVRTNGQILGTWDFVDSDTAVAEDDAHGMHCLSTIGANMPGVFVGTAPQSSFYLFRTEDVSTEYPIEEHNFAVGVERADSLGVDLCSVSLGYSTFDNAQFNYSYNDMNGNTTISAKAADIAAKKGLLMVLAAGNEGSRSWRYIITPADADSALTVGAVDTLGNVAGFSSYGPSSDGQIKPDVAAVGRNAVVANSFSGLPVFSNGTSFACPNMAGIATCLWQAFPELNNMKIIRTLQQSSDKANTPNDRVGYGIPDAQKAFVMLQKETSSYSATFNQCHVDIQLNLKTDSSMYVEVERKLSGEYNYSAVHTFHSNAPFGMRSLNYDDNLYGQNISSAAYRLKVKIGSDTTYYLDSSAIAIAIDCSRIPPSANNILITPNPFRDQLSLTIARTATTPMQIVIYNAQGQRMHAENYRQEIGTSIKNINTSHWSKGFYVVQVYANGTLEKTRKIIRL
jgi:hypothetical protein